MRLGDIKDWHNALPSTGGFLQLPDGPIDYRVPGEEVVITKNNVKISGHGCNMSDSESSRAISQINYTGTGVAIQIGASNQGNSVVGTELRDFGIKGSGNGIAGVLVEGNVNDGILNGRILLENLDTRGFLTGCGVDLHYGISVTLRRLHAFRNQFGVRIRWGNGYKLDNCVMRHNVHGVRAIAFRILSILDSIIESNDGPGLVLLMEDVCEMLTVSGTWFENNNVVPSGDANANNAVYIAAAIPAAGLKSWSLRNSIFNGGPGGDLYHDNLKVEHFDPRHVRWSNGTFTV